MYQIILSEHFKRCIKGLQKKHPELIEDVVDALKHFDPAVNISLGFGTYKMRVGSRSMRKGKRGAFRMIVLLLEIHSIITPLAIYAKSDKETLSRQEILYHAFMVRRELQ